MFSFLLAAVLTMVTFYTAILYKSPSLILLGYAQGILLLSAAAFLFYRSRTLACSVSVPIAIAERGQSVTLHIQVDNNSFLPCARLRFRLVCANRFLPGSLKKWVRSGAVYPGANCFDYKMKLQDFGSFDLQVEKIRIYDLTGLFYVNKRINSAGAVQVLPALQEVSVRMTESARNFFGDADVYDTERPGHDSSELFQIRPFRNGDKIQRIHWKLSAKQEELLVKEDSMPRACAVILLLNDRFGGRSSRGVLNAYLQIVAGISFSLMDAGCAHYVAWYSVSRRDVCRFRVDDEESLYLFLNLYMQDFSKKGPADIREAYREKYRGENYLHMLSVDGSLKLTQDLLQLAQFSERRWRQELEQLELII